MGKRAEFNNALKESMKAKNEVATATVRLILAALKERDIAARGQGRVDGITDQEVLGLLQSMVKQRHESTKTYRDAGREDLATREEAEIKVIEGFLPRQLGADEAEKIIQEVIKTTGAAGIKDMGKVMGALKGQYAGQIDMAKAGEIVKRKLG